MPENPTTFLTVGQFKLACIDDLSFSDAQVKTLMGEVYITSEEDVLEFCAILNKYRPKVANELSEKILSKKSRE